MKAIIQVQQPIESSLSMDMLHETSGGTLRDGSGYSCIGYVDPSAEWVTVMVDTSEDTVNTIVANATNYPPVAAAEFTAWEPGLNVKPAEIYSYDGSLYQVIQTHTTQSDWTPDIVPALFREIYEPSDKPWPWVQPQGAHDAYPIGAKVTHNGYTWESNTAANVWEPGVYGWDNLTQPEPPVGEWSYPVAYKVGDEVTYDSHLYRCLQAHTSQAGWTPPVVPALWLLVA